MIDARSLFFDNDSDEDADNDLEHVDDEPDDCAKDLSEDEEELGEPITLQHTISLKQRLINEDITAKVKSTLSFMKQQGINLPIFLDALSWVVLAVTPILRSNMQELVLQSATSFLESCGAGTTRREVQI
jgi:hypothetical protein